MDEGRESPRIQAGGLVTVAFLKARLDEGRDHLGIFMPLVLDVLRRFTAQSFTTQDIQEALAADHGVAMPLQTVVTLLKRATGKRYIVRDSGRYRRNPAHSLPDSNVVGEKAQIEIGQKSLGEGLRRHAATRGMVLDDTETALDRLFRFLEEEQVGLLLGSPSAPIKGADVSLRERAIVAEFVRDVVRHDAALTGVLRGVLEGLVLYHAAFLPDVNNANRAFKDVQVIFDSHLVMQALGYEGAAMRTLMGETRDVLSASGARCLVFDKTMHEIQRILAFYEARLGTAEGCRSIRPVPMARHFLTQRYSPSDVREMSALLEREIVAAGFLIREAPSRVRDYTAGERALATRLAAPATKDETEPRVVHDVDCVAGILTLRKGHRSSRLEDVRAIFVTDSPLVIRNSRLWWDEDEHETGIPPVVHIRALSNVAWLKKPHLCSDFKLHELVALCTAALRPSQETWQRFLRHLDSLQKSAKLKSDDVAAILVSAMLDPLLRGAEMDEDDPDDIDATTLDEIVERVTSSYAAGAEDRVRAITSEYEGKLAGSEERERTAAEVLRRRALADEGRARAWARRITQIAQWIVVALVVAGAIALILGHPFHGGLVGVVVGSAIVVFVSLELVGILRHVSEWRTSMERRLTRRIREWLGGNDEPDGEQHGGMT